MWKRPPGRGAFLAVSLETSFTPVLENKNDKRRGKHLGLKDGQVSRFLREHSGRDCFRERVCLSGGGDTRDVSLEFYPGGFICEGEKIERYFAKFFRIEE
jgi:hypothetical protein